jgi:N-acetylglucosamine-6-sulfatase
MGAMPNVNELLGRLGTTYTQYLSSFPLCCPSRATLLTGQYAHNSGVEGNARPHGGFTKFRQEETLSVWLSRAGYTTAHVGKFLNVYGRRNPLEIPLGWTEWVTAPFPSEHEFYDYTLNVNGALQERGHAPEDYIDDVYTEHALDFINRRAPEEAPFFLALDFLAPHEGVTHEATRCGRSARPAPRDAGHFATLPLPRPPSFDELDLGDKPQVLRVRPALTPEQVLAITEDYQCRRESLLAVDDAVARIVQALEAAGELDNTYILYLSDNGYFQGEHRLPNGKTRVYDAVTRVPLLIRGPGVAEGELLDNPVANIDIAPTVLDLAGATGEVGEHFQIDGHSLLPQLTGNDPDEPAAGHDRAVLLENGPGFSAGPRYRAVRTLRYVYIEYGTGERELYDLRRDPWELDSRHDDPAYAPVRDALAPVLERLRSCSGGGCDQAVSVPEPVDVPQ